MTRRPFISSSSNPRLKVIRRLRRCSRRGRSDVFLVDGYRQLAAALAAGARVRHVYASPELYLGRGDAELVAHAERRGAEVVELGAAAFESIAAQARPDGICAVLERWTTTLAALSLGPRPLLLVAEGVERPGNLGSIVRTACGAGADAAVVCDGATDPFHPDSVRGTAGTLFKLPVAEAATPAAISWLRKRGIAIVVAAPNADRTYRECDFTGPAAVVVGNERYGVTRPWLEAADATVRIPMRGGADSLNVAVAAGVVLFEAASQRVSREAAAPSAPAPVRAGHRG